MLGKEVLVFVSHKSAVHLRSGGSVHPQECETGGINYYSDHLLYIKLMTAFKL